MLILVSQWSSWEGEVLRLQLNRQGRVMVLGYFFLICEFTITDQEVIIKTLLEEDKEPYNSYCTVIF